MSGSRLSAVPALVFDFKQKFLAKGFLWHDGIDKDLPQTVVKLNYFCLWFLHTVLHRNSKYP